jgi:hypothetical protein
MGAFESLKIKRKRKERKMKKDTKVVKMQMTNDEIVKSWQEAKDRTAQIKILAELNLCPKEVIIDILKQSGVDPRKLPRKRSGKPFVLSEAEGEAETETETDVKSNAEVRPVPSAEDDVITEALMEYRAKLVRNCAEMKEEYEAIMAKFAGKIYSIDCYLAGVSET